MRKSLTLVTLAAALLLTAGLVLAQTKAPAKTPAPVRSSSEELLAAWNSTHKKLIDMAEDFAEAKYDFKPNPAQRSFAEQLLHVAGADYLILSAAAGKKMGPEGGEEPPRSAFKTKADVVNLLKQVTADGAAWIKAQGDAGLSKEIRFPFGNRMVHTSFALWDIIEHEGEHYGQLVVYYRVNNMVPPASR